MAKHSMKRFIVILAAACVLWPCRAQQTSTEVFRAALEAQGVTFTNNNSIVLLHNGRDKFNAMFDAIRSARRYVYLEYFNFRNDSIGLALFDLLGQKAQEGVEVRAMFDSFGNKSNDSPLQKHHLKAIRATGVDVREFDPMCFPWINHVYHRDHRKIVIIDGEVCFTGGMNVADYYIHGRPEYGAWRDMHMQLTGDAVARYEEIFRTMWKSAFDVQLAEHEPASFDSPSYLTLLTDTSATASHKCVGVVDRTPGRHSKDMRKAYCAAIDAAQKHIQIVNPYPVNVKSVRRALRRALKRGVRLEIMVSSRSDVPVTPDVVGLEMKKLASRGAEVYYNNEGFHHSKIMMVDSAYCTVGSTNMDARSFLFDYEVNSFILDSATTGELQSIFEKDKLNCTLFTAKDWRKRFNLGHRITGRLFSLLRGFF